MIIRISFVGKIILTNNLDSYKMVINILAE